MVVYSMFATVLHVDESLNLGSTYRLAVGNEVHIGMYKLESFLLGKFCGGCSKRLQMKILLKE